MKNKIIKDLKAKKIINILADEPLYKHTSYRVGGPALVYVEATNYYDITTTIDYALANQINYLILGNGSNVLISDKTFEGIVISTKNLDGFEISGNTVFAMCGTNLINLAMQTANQSLTGLEFASGIPGLIGGSIYMNAGAYKKDLASVVSRVLVYRDGEQVWMDKDELDFSYRHSIFQDKPSWVVLAVELNLAYGEKESILATIKQRRNRRMATQPYDAYSAGSVFKNPEDDVFSWQLIDEVGLRGYRINDAQISLKHSNFIINLDRASAQDIYNLINHTKAEVEKKFNITLKTEQELVNFNEK